MNTPPPQNQLDYFTPVIAIHYPQQPAPTSHQIAGAGARALAALFDLAIQIILLIIITRLVLPPETWKWAVPLSFLHLHIIYHLLFEVITRGHTPGLALFRLRIISNTGTHPSPRQLLKRNITRLADIALGLYTVTFIKINQTPTRQSLGDLIAHTHIIYKTPLRQQMAAASVPESFYSTSEAGYLLQAWIQRSSRMDRESKAASALDLGAYLHSVYEPHARDLPEPAAYLHHLFDRETRRHKS